MIDIKQYIKDELKAKGISQVHLSRLLNVHPVCVHDVISGKRSTERIRQVVAMAIGKTVEDLWPKKNASPPAGGNGPAVGSVGRTSDPSRG